MSEIKVNKLTPRTACGTTTLGDSGDTFNIPAGVTISNNGTATGFGATGAVNWDVASIKTTDFTAVSGVGYFVDTATTGAVIVTLPAAPSVGDVVGVADYANNFADANCTLNRNSLKIGGLALNGTLETSGIALTLVYVDVTKGWIVTDSGDQTEAGTQKFVAATGGCITTCGSYKMHTFLSPGTFTVTCVGNPGGSQTIDYLVVAGGGGSGGDGGGGGGAGGFRISNSVGGIPAPAMTPLANPTGLPVTATGYPVVVGAGGAGAAGGNAPAGGAAKGSDSVFTGSSTITSTGGGQTGCYSGSSGPGVGFPGGSGGGGSRHLGTNAGGTGNTPPVSPSQGNNGGTSQPPTSSSAAGGGAGAAAVTVTAPGSPTQNGGAGTFVATAFAPACVGTPGPSAGRWFAGGGAAGGNAPGTTPATGGAGGGGNAINSCTTSKCGTAGTTNTGGGAGGGGNDTAGKTGGSGIVIIRYKYQ